MPSERLLSLFTILSIPVATIVGACRSPAPSDDLSTLAQVIGPSLPFDVRLSHGFAPADSRATRGESQADPPTLPPDARIAIAQLEKRASSDPTPTAVAAVGVAYLVQRKVDLAVTTLERAAMEANESFVWNDLSAAYLAKAATTPTRRIEYYSRGFDAASRALQLAPSHEALFNRAVAIEGLRPYTGAPGQWDDYVRTEPDRKWIDVGSRHLAEARPVSDVVERWDSRKRDLATALKASDRSAVQAIVREFPEASIDYFDREAMVAWSRGEEPTLNLARLLATSIADVTGDSMAKVEVALASMHGKPLAEAHLDYASALTLYDADDFDRALDLFVRAAARFDQARSPYRAWAIVGEITVLFLQRHLDLAEERLIRLEQEYDRDPYNTLKGRLMWLHGLVELKKWRLSAALEAFRLATETFEKANEREYAVNLYSHTADALRTLGEYRESWQYMGRTLEGLRYVRRPIRRYLFLYNASLFASGQNLLSAALAFQDAAVREATRAGAGPAIEALTQRAGIEIRRSNFPAASDDLAAAQRLIDREPPGIRKDWAVAEIRMVAAGVKGRPAALAVSDLQQALRFFASAEPSMVPRLELDLARTLQAQGDTKGASAAFARGIEVLESQQAQLNDDAFRISYFDEAWGLFPGMIDLQLSKLHDDSKAFEYAERSRARALLMQTGPSTVRPSQLSDIQSQLPNSVVLLYYVTLQDRIVIWAIRRDGAYRTQSPTGRDDLAKLVATHRFAVAQRQDDASAAGRLYDILLGPVASRIGRDATLVVIPDGDLQRVPFAALRDSASGRYVIEDHAIAISPSASFFLIAARRIRDRGAIRPASALLVGDPTQQSVDQSLPALPGAESEVLDSGRFYAKPMVLTGMAATKKRFIDSAPNHDVVHFGGHAFVNAEYPALSRLAFASQAGGEPEPLYAYEISRIDFRRTRLVVLAACSTAAGTLSRGEGVMSVARPFLGVGVPTVVASHWDVDDRATRRLFVEFHRSMAHTGDPVNALRRAQLTMLHSGDRSLFSPDIWGAFVVLGGTVE